jgi:F-type H+-transporting ATPase subunit b
MDGKAKEGLAQALKTTSEPAVVRSTFDLPPEQRAAIQNALNETFSAEIHVRFETAPDLISGIELTTNGQKVAWSIADYLASMEKGVSDLLKEKAQAEAKAEPKPEPKPEVPADAKSKPEPGAKPEVPADAKPTPEPEAKPEVPVEAKPTPEPEAKPKVPAEAKSTPEPEAKPDVPADAKPTPEPEAKPKPEPAEPEAGKSQ